MKNSNQTKSKRSQLRITIWNCPISTRQWISFNLNFPNSAVFTKCNMAETWLFKKRAKKNGFKFSIRGGGFHWVFSAYGFFNRSFVVIYDRWCLPSNKSSAMGENFIRLSCWQSRFGYRLLPHACWLPGRSNGMSDSNRRISLWCW